MLRRISKVLLTLATALTVSACANQTKIPPDKLAGIKSIAVISATGDRLNWQAEAAISLFDRERRTIAIPEWGADGRIEKAIVASLKPRYAFITLVGIDRKALAAAKGPEAVAALRNAIGTSMNAPDAVLLVREREIRWDRAPTDAPPTVNGVGLYRKGSIAGPTIVAHACLEMQLIETKNFTTIASLVNSIPNEGGTWPHVILRHPLYGGVSDIWADRFEDTPPDKKAQIQATVNYLIDRSFPHTFQRYGLIE